MLLPRLPFRPQHDSIYEHLNSTTSCLIQNFTGSGQRRDENLNELMELSSPDLTIGCRRSHYRDYWMCD